MLKNTIHLRIQGFFDMQYWCLIGIVGLLGSYCILKDSLYPDGIQGFFEICSIST